MVRAIYRFLQEFAVYAFTNVFVIHGVFLSILIGYTSIKFRMAQKIFVVIFSLTSPFPFQTGCLMVKQVTYIFVAMSEWQNVPAKHLQQHIFGSNFIDLTHTEKMNGKTKEQHQLSIYRWLLRYKQLGG